MINLCYAATHTHIHTRTSTQDIKPCWIPKTLTSKTFTSRREQGMKLKTHTERKQPPISPTQWYTEDKTQNSSRVESDRRQGTRQRRLYRANQVKLVPQESGETKVCAGQVWFRLTEVSFWSTQTGTRQQTLPLFFFFALAWLDWCSGSAATMWPALGRLLGGEWSGWGVV